MAMKMPLAMQIVINLSTFSSFLLLVLFLTGKLKRTNRFQLLLSVGVGIAFIQGMDLLIGNFLEELWLILATVGLYGWLNGFKNLRKLKTSYALIIATIFSYIIVMLSSVLTTVGLIGYTHLKGLDNLMSSQFNWQMVCLIMLSQLLIAAGLGLIVQRLDQLIKASIASYGMCVAGTILAGLALFVVAVMVLFDSFKHANLPVEYLYLAFDFLVKKLIGHSHS